MEEFQHSKDKNFSQKALKHIQRKKFWCQKSSWKLKSFLANSNLTSQIWCENFIMSSLNCGGKNVFLWGWVTLLFLSPQSSWMKLGLCTIRVKGWLVIKTTHLALCPNKMIFLQNNQNIGSYFYVKNKTESFLVKNGNWDDTKLNQITKQICIQVGGIIKNYLSTEFNITQK